MPANNVRYCYICRAGLIGRLSVVGGVSYNQGIILVDDYFKFLDSYVGDGEFKVDLEFVLAHEFDHGMMRPGHNTPAGAPDWYASTLHAKECSGLY